MSKDNLINKCVKASSEMDTIGKSKISKDTFKTIWICEINKELALNVVKHFEALWQDVAFDVSRTFKYLSKSIAK